MAHSKYSPDVTCIKPNNYFPCETEILFSVTTAEKDLEKSEIAYKL
jgi:hypothetical protein